jgi:hypothetical protein
MIWDEEDFGPVPLEAHPNKRKIIGIRAHEQILTAIIVEV